MRSEENKIELLAVLRGIATIYVLLGHVVLVGGESHFYDTFHSILYMFHMPLFFAISGFLFGYKEFERDSIYIIKKKLVSLGIPYIFFGVIYIIFKTILQSFVDVESKTSFADTLKLFYNPNQTVYWFLYDLLLYSILCALIKKNKKFLFGCVAISLISYFAYFSYENLDNRWWRCLAYLFTFIVPFFVGKKYGSNEKKRNSNSSLIVLSSIFILVTVSYILLGKQSGIVLSIFRFITLITGIALSLELAIFFEKQIFMKRILLFVSHYSWYIYLLHPYFMNAARNIILKRVNCTPFVEIFTGVFVGSIGPVLLAMVVKKIKYIDFVFTPQKYMIK